MNLKFKEELAAILADGEKTKGKEALAKRLSKFFDAVADIDVCGDCGDIRVITGDVCGDCEALRARTAEVSEVIGGMMSGVEAVRDKIRKDRQDRSVELQRDVDKTGAEVLPRLRELERRGALRVTKVTTQLNTSSGARYYAPHFHITYRHPEGRSVEARVYVRRSTGSKAAPAYVEFQNGSSMALSTDSSWEAFISSQLSW